MFLPHGHINVVPTIKDEEVIVMPHVVTNDDLNSMRTGIRNLNARLADWSEMITKISSSADWIPKNTGHDYDYKGFNVTNKKMFEGRMGDALKLARKIKVTAADLVVDMEGVLNVSSGSEAFDPAKQQTTTRTFGDYKNAGCVDWNEMRNPRDPRGLECRKNMNSILLPQLQKLSS
jgi:hypothetical protein